MSKRKNSILKRNIEAKSQYNELMKLKVKPKMSKKVRRNNKDSFPNEILLKSYLHEKEFIYIRIRCDLTHKEVHFLKSSNNCRTYSNNINSASVFPDVSLQNIPKKDNVKYFVIQLPKQQFLQADNKISFLRKLFKESFYPDLFNFQNIIQE